LIVLQVVVQWGYMNTKQEQTQTMYRDIFEVLDKYENVCSFDIKELKSKAKLHEFGTQLVEEYGLNIEAKDVRSYDWNRFGEYMAIGQFGEKTRRTISWSDDGKQPGHGILLNISFPTGGYIFGDDYPQELFQELFLELKSYNPEYCDTVNKNLYFSMDNAKDVFNNFAAILARYHEKNKEQTKDRKIKKMKEALEKLEASE